MKKMILFTLVLLSATTFLGQSKKEILAEAKELKAQSDSLEQLLEETNEKLQKCGGDNSVYAGKIKDLEEKIESHEKKLADYSKKSNTPDKKTTSASSSGKKKSSAKTATAPKAKAEKKDEKKVSSASAKPAKKSETATGFKTKAELIKFLENGGHGKEYMDMLRYLYNEDSDSSLVSWLKKLDTTQVFGPMQTARSTYTGIPEPRWLATDVDNQKVIYSKSYGVHIVVSDGSLVRDVPVVDATDYNKIEQMIADGISPLQSSVDSLSGDVSDLTEDSSEQFADLKASVKKLDNNTILYTILCLVIVSVLLLIFAQWYSLRKARNEERKEED